MWVMLDKSILNWGCSLYHLHETAITVSISKIIPKNLVFKSIFDFYLFYTFCNKDSQLNEGGQT